MLPKQRTGSGVSQTVIQRVDAGHGHWLVKFPDQPASRVFAKGGIPLGVDATFDYAADYAAITIPSMLTENQGDQFFLQQGAEAYAKLTNVPPADKVLLPLTAPQGAQLHDQPNGPQVAQEYIFDWLDQYLR